MTEANPNDYGKTQLKKLVDQVLSFDVLRLQKDGVFAFRGRWTFAWKQGDSVVFSMEYWVIDGGQGSPLLQIFYKTRDCKGIETSHDYPVSLDFTLLNFGGGRWWFRCPMVIRGETCGRRCRILYLPTGALYWGCRECHRLTYESRKRHRELAYEMGARPLKVLTTVEERLRHTRSPHRRAALLEKKKWAMSTVMRGLSHSSSYKAALIGLKVMDTVGW